MEKILESDYKKYEKHNRGTLSTPSEALARGMLQGTPRGMPRLYLEVPTTFSYDKSYEPPEVRGTFSDLLATNSYPPKNKNPTSSSSRKSSRDTKFLTLSEKNVHKQPKWPSGGNKKEKVVLLFILQICYILTNPLRKRRHKKPNKEGKLNL